MRRISRWTARRLAATVHNLDWNEKTLNELMTDAQIRQLADAVDALCDELDTIDRRRWLHHWRRIVRRDARPVD